MLGLNYYAEADTEETKDAPQTSASPSPKDTLLVRFEDHEDVLENNVQMIPMFNT